MAVGEEKWDKIICFPCNKEFISDYNAAMHAYRNHETPLYKAYRWYEINQFKKEEK